MLSHTILTHEKSAPSIPRCALENSSDSPFVNSRRESFQASTISPEKIFSLAVLPRDPQCFGLFLHAHVVRQFALHMLNDNTHGFSVGCADFNAFDIFLIEFIHRARTSGDASQLMQRDQGYSTPFS